MKRKIGAMVADAKRGRQGLCRLPRARSDLLLGDLEDVHRSGLHGARPEEHRRRRRLGRVRLPAALGRVRRLLEPRHHRARRHGLLRAEGVDGRCAPGWTGSARFARLGRADRRLDRLTLGAAARRLLPRDVVGAHAPSPVAHGHPVAERAPEVRARGADAGLGVLARSRSCSSSLASALARRRSTSASERCSSPRRPSPRLPGVSTVALRRPRRRSSGRSGFRASCSRRSSAAMLAVAGATYQGVFRNPLADPYLLGVAAGAGLGATIAIAYLPDGAARPADARRRGVRRRLGRRLPRRTRSAAPRAASATPATLVLAGVTVDGVLHRLADVRPAAELGDAAGGLHVDPREHPEHGLVGRRPDPPVRRGGDRRRPRAPPGRGRPQPRRRRGRESRGGRAPGATRSRRRGDARDRRCRRRQRPHRIRRDHRPAHDPAADRVGYRALAAAVGRRRQRGSSCSQTSSPGPSLAPAEIPLGVVTAFFGAPFFALVLRTTPRGAG